MNCRLTRATWEGDKEDRRARYRGMHFSWNLVDHQPFEEISKTLTVDEARGAAQRVSDRLTPKDFEKRFKEVRNQWDCQVKRDKAPNTAALRVLAQPDVTRLEIPLAPGLSCGFEMAHHPEQGPVAAGYIKKTSAPGAAPTVDKEQAFRFSFTMLDSALECFRRQSEMLSQTAAPRPGDPRLAKEIAEREALLHGLQENINQENARLQAELDALKTQRQREIADLQRQLKEARNAGTSKGIEDEIDRIMKGIAERKGEARQIGDTLKEWLKKQNERLAELAEEKKNALKTKSDEIERLTLAIQSSTESLNKAAEMLAENGRKFLKNIADQISALTSELEDLRRRQQEEARKAQEQLVQNATVALESVLSQDEAEKTLEEAQNVQLEQYRVVA